jgi:hypothetical protein
MFKCEGSPYHEEGAYEEHQKEIKKLRRLWRKIYWKINQKSKSLVERSLTEVGD